MPKFDVTMQLSGNDGNAGTIMGSVSRGLKQAGATTQEVDQFRNEAMSGDYDNLLKTAMKWVNVE